MPVVRVSDSLSNANDQIVRAAKVVGSGKRSLVFDAISKGKRKNKTVTELGDLTGLSKKEVLTHARHLVNEGIVHQEKRGGETAYSKNPFFAQSRLKVLALGRNPIKRALVPTKSRPISTVQVSVEVPVRRIAVKRVFVDDIAEFRKVKLVGRDVKEVGLSEQATKEGVARLLGETGQFRDWGGEKHDLYTSQLHIGSQRLGTAIAFKGPGTRGKLTIAKMGKNGDQIQRLFANAADLYIVQYHGQVEESIVSEMQTYATMKSVVEARKILFAIIDGVDTARIVSAYPDQF